MENRILEITDQMFDAAKSQRPLEDEEAWTPVDFYQKNMVTRRDNATKQYPHGSSAIVNTAVNAVVDGMGAEGLARAHKRAEDDSESLRRRGEKDRAEIRRQQYMDEDFLPAVEVVVHSTSPDELLNSKKALAELDKYVMLPGNGAGKGYTASYVRSAYGNQLGQAPSRSDDTVTSSIRKLNLLLDEGQNRSALGLATKLKQKIDSGEAMSDDADYALLERVVAYFG